MPKKKKKTRTKTTHHKHSKKSASNSRPNKIRRLGLQERADILFGQKLSSQSQTPDPSSQSTPDPSSQDSREDKYAAFKERWSIFREKNSIRKFYEAVDFKKLKPDIVHSLKIFKDDDTAKYEDFRPEFTDKPSGNFVFFVCLYLYLLYICVCLYLCDLSPIISLLSRIKLAIDER